MAVLQMQRISICGLKYDRSAILEILQRQSVIEVEDFGDFEDDDIFVTRPAPISGAEFEHNIRDAENALTVLNTYAEEKTGLLASLSGRRIMSLEEYQSFGDKYQRVNRTINRLLELSKKITEQNAEIVKDTQQIEMLKPWSSLDIPLDTAGTCKTTVFIGVLPNVWTADEIAGIMPEEISVSADVVSSSREQTCIFLVCLKEDAAAVLAALKSKGFAYPAVSCNDTPAEQKEKLETRIKELEAVNRTDAEEIASYAAEREDIKFMSVDLPLKAARYAVGSTAYQSEHTFVVTGYIPQREVERVRESLAEYPVDISTQDVTEEENCPTVLKNNAFSRPMEGVISSYSMPSRRDIDPAFLMSIFYYLLFGFMLSDAAFGLIIFVGALVLLLKNPNMEKGFKKTVQLYMIGGVSAIFWGVMFGSYFGDFITKVSGTFFGHEIVIQPLWLDMQKDPMTVLTLSLAIGVIHIFLGMGVQAYQLIKRKDIVALIFDIFAWYIIIIGLLLELLSMQLAMDILFGGIAPFIPASVGRIGLYAAGVAAVAVVIMAGRESKNPLKRLLKGLYAVYGVTSYLSDILSYCRLLALGLATGVICSVANMIGTMFGGGVLGLIIFVVVFIIINFINIFINGLGAYVHTNRLMYVEFFSRFYEGGGREFQPFGINTKYYKFKENEK